MKRFLLIMLTVLLASITVKAKEAYAVFTSDGTLTFYYDNLKSSRSGTIYADMEKYANKTAYYYHNSLRSWENDPSWYSIRTSIKLVAFDKSFYDFEVTSTGHWFLGCSNLTHINNLNYLNTSKLTYTYSMFSGCQNLRELDLSNMCTSNVKYMSYMFYGCKSLTNLDLSSFDTGIVVKLASMFENCSSLKSLIVSSFNTEKVTDMGEMFRGCTKLQILNLESFNTSRVSYMYYMFSDCSSLKTIYVDGNLWNTKKVGAGTNRDGLFSGCIKLVGGKGTKYDAKHVDVTYARIDGGTSNPGYLTDIKDKKQEVDDSDDLQEFLDSLADHSGTEGEPVIVPVASSGMTVGGNVDINKEVHLLFDGGAGEPLAIKFVGGVISINDKNSSLTFNNVIMTINAMARGLDMVTKTANSGGIVNGGKLLLTGCTVADGLITNSGSVFIDGATTVSGMTNRLGGCIYITSPMTKTVSISISENDIETGTPIILGGKGYTLTKEDAAHVSIALPTAYEWKYDASKRAIVIIKKGDSNDDNTIDVADIATIISYMAGGVVAEDLKRVDVNGDGVVDVADIATVISIMAGK